MKFKSFIFIGIPISIIGIVLLIIGITRPSFKTDELFIGYYDLIETNYNVEEVNNIKINCNYDIIEIKSSEREDIKIITKNGDNISYGLKQDTNTYSLEIIQKADNDYIVPNLQPLIIELPKTKILSFEMDCDCVDINVYSVNLGDFNAIIDAGNLEIENSNINNLDVKINAGKVKSKNLEIVSGSIITDVGSVDLGINPSKSLNIDISVGSINLRLKKGSEFYTINGIGNGEVIIIAKTEVGKFNYIFE